VKWFKWASIVLQALITVFAIAVFINSADLVAKLIQVIVVLMSIDIILSEIKHH
jgi:hypothetical protein